MGKILLDKTEVQELIDKIRNHEVDNSEISSIMASWIKYRKSPDFDVPEGNSILMSVTSLNDMQYRLCEMEIRREQIISSVFDLLFTDLDGQRSMISEESRQDEDFYVDNAHQYPLLSAEFIQSATRFKDDVRTMGYLKWKIFESIGLSYDEYKNREMEETNKRLNFTVAVPFGLESNRDEVKKWYNGIKGDFSDNLSSRICNVSRKGKLTGRSITIRGLFPEIEGPYIEITGIKYLVGLLG